MTCLFCEVNFNIKFCCVITLRLNTDEFIEAFGLPLPVIQLLSLMLPLSMTRKAEMKTRVLGKDSSDECSSVGSRAEDH